MRCPTCRGELTFNPGDAECAACGRSYPVIGDVPVLLVEAAR